MTTTSTSTAALTAAQALAQVLPTTIPLTVDTFSAAAAPASDAQAVTAHFVGSTSADLILVAGDATAAMLADAGEDVSVAEVLRPCLEAATSALGAGVLDNAVVTQVGSSLQDPDTEVFALVDESGIAHAWFGVRIRTAVQPAAAPKAAPADAETERNKMRILHDVELVLTAEIGHTRLPMRQVLDLVPGTVLELDRAAGSPADVMVNGRLVARGEVVVVDEDYGIRITELVAPESGL